MAFGACLIVGGLIAGCSSSGAGGTYGVAAAGSGSCKQLNRRMNNLLARGKQDGPQYRKVLDTYLARGCYH